MVRRSLALATAVLATAASVVAGPAAASTPVSIVPRHARAASGAGLTVEREVATAIAGTPVDRSAGPATGGDPVVQALGASPLPTTTVPGIEGDGVVFPPDAHGAVGAGHLVEVTATSVRISSTAGATQAETSLLDWWQTFDRSIADAVAPQVVWEPLGQRFVMAASVEPGAREAAVVVAVSRTTDPTAGWWMTRVDVDAGGAFDAGSTRVGHAGGWITVAVDRSEITTGAAAGAIVLAFDRVEAEDADAHMAYARVVDPQRRGVVPVTAADPFVASQLLVSDAGDGASLTIGSISGSASVATYRPVATTVRGKAWATSPVDAPQLGSPVPVDTGDTRLGSCTVRNGSVWCAHTVFLPPADPTRSVVQWWQFLPDGTVLQQGRVGGDAPGEGAVFTAFPSLAVNGAGDALLGFARFSAATHPSGAYRFRSVVDPVGSMRRGVVFAPGDAPYVDLDEDGRNRWGGTSATVVDPADGTAWTLQASSAVPGADGDRWRTGWAGVTPPAVSGSDVAVALSGVPARSLVGRVADVELVAVANGAQGPSDVTLWVGSTPEARVVSVPSLCEPSAGGMACPIGALEVGEVARLGVGVRIRVTGEVTLEASVTSGDDPNRSNDTTTVGVVGLDETTCTQRGTPGNDQLFGTPGTDVLCAGGGDDVVYPGGGEDLVLGGGGFDYVAYADVDRKVHVDLGAAAAIVAKDVADLRSIEGAFGGPRNDVVIGGPGDDVLTGLGGDDRIDGGGGADTVSYYSCVGDGCQRSPVAVNLSTGTGRGPAVGIDRLRRVEYVYGSLLGDDRLTGDWRRNLLYGFGGRDLLAGLGDDDYLSGGDGADRLDGGAGDDHLSGGRGFDSCLGGMGTTTTDTCP